MNIKDALILNFGYKPTVDKIVDYILSNPNEIKKLLDCFFAKEVMLCQRAAWPLGDIGCKNPKLILPFLSKLLKALDKPKHDAIVRNVIRILQVMEIPEKYTGAVFERCINYIIDPKIPVAIRAFSMTVCANICKNYPDFKGEVIAAIESDTQTKKPAYLGRAKAVLQVLYRIK